MIQNENISNLINKIYDLSQENARLRKELRHYNYILIGILIGITITAVIFASPGG